METSSNRSRVFGAAIIVAGLVACAGEPKPAEQPSGTAPGVGAVGATTPVGGPFNPDAGGKVVTVDLVTDGVGNYFKPAEVHVNPGDVVRFNLKLGVHNIHFVADSNAGKSAYPQTPSDFLQRPGQSWDLLVRLPKGSYYFQCDPHSALGMQGHLVVE